MTDYMLSVLLGVVEGLTEAVCVIPWFAPNTLMKRFWPSRTVEIE